VIFRVLDIETVPDESCWTRGEPAYKLVPGPLQQVGGGSGLGSVVMMSAAGVAVVEPFPPPQACRVVALSCVDVVFDLNHDPKYRFGGCWSDCLWCPWDLAEADRQERIILDKFGAGICDDVHLVTWNGRGFDLPVISMRSLKHRVSCGWYYKKQGGKEERRYRYSTEGHCDLMDYLSDYGASRQMRLGDCARLIGLPGKTDMSGDKVDVLYRQVAEQPELSAEHAAKIRRYCQQDTLQTALLFVRTRYHFGKLSPESHDATMRTFRDSEAVREAIDVDWDKLMLSGRQAASPGGADGNQ